MTDVSLAVSAGAEDLLSPKELAPPSAAPVADAPPGKPCPHCPQTFPGVWGAANLTRHLRRDHPTIPLTKSHNATDAAKEKRGPGRPKKVKPPDDGTPPPSTKRRRPAGDTLSRGAVWLAKLLMPIDPPVARAISFEAPALGAAIDDIVAGTFVDTKFIQPMANASDKWEKLSSVVSVPIIIALIERFPNLESALEDDLREAVEDVLIATVPLMKKKADRRQKAAEALKELGALDPVFAATADPVGAIIQGWFLPPVVPDDGGVNADA